MSCCVNPISVQYEKKGEPYYINANLWVFASGYHSEYLNTPSTPLQLVRRK